jgi:hypothetical protein
LRDPPWALHLHAYRCVMLSLLTEETPYGEPSCIRFPKILEIRSI